MITVGSYELSAKNLANTEEDGCISELLTLTWIQRNCKKNLIKKFQPVFLPKTSYYVCTIIQFPPVGKSPWKLQWT